MPYSTGFASRLGRQGVVCILLVMLAWPAAGHSPGAPVPSPNGAQRPRGLRTSQAMPQLPPGFKEDVVLANLPPVTTIDWAPDGRMFLALRDGQVWIYENGGLVPDPFIDVSAEVNTFGDRGLMGMALHPDFDGSPYVYLLYVYDPPDLPQTNTFDSPDGAGARVSRLLRVTADPNHPNQALPGSEMVLLGTNSLLEYIVGVDQDSVVFAPFPPPGCMVDGVPVQDCVPADSFAHSAGALRFGPDGSLYVSHGDASTPHFADYRALRAQNLDIPAGKILRIDPMTGAAYPNNEFFDGDVASNRSKVVAYGLRYPFRFVFQPMTGELLIGDVGYNSYEELNVGRGHNYGWPCYEGPFQNPLYAVDPTTAAACAEVYALTSGSVTPPTFAYPRPAGGSALMAGPVYSGTNYPAEYQGIQFIGDYSGAWIKTIDLAAPEPALTDFLYLEDELFYGPVDIRLGPDGNLYYVAFGTNDAEIRRIRYTAGGNTAPTARLSATPDNRSLPLLVSFSAAGSTDPDNDPLTFDWAFGDGEFAAGVQVTHTYTSAATYTTVLTVTDSLSATSTAQVQIAAGNNRPVVTLLTPITGTLYQIEQQIEFTGSATDVEDGDLEGEQLQWSLILHHNQHVHPNGLSPTGGTNGSFVVPDYGDNTWLELCLTATDNGGLSALVCRPLVPDAVLYSFRTSPSGLNLIYDGAARTTPFDAAVTIGAVREVIAPTTQAGLTFTGWPASLEPSLSFTATTPGAVLTATYSILQWLPMVTR